MTTATFTCDRCGATVTVPARDGVVAADDLIGWSWGSDTVRAADGTTLTRWSSRCPAHPVSRDPDHVAEDVDA